MVEIPEQLNLLDIDPDWKKIWEGMPDFVQNDLESWHSVIVHFANPSDMEKFSEVVGQNLSKDTRSLWYPKAEIGHISNKRYFSINPVNPRYPVYIISKGRWETRLTSKALEKIQVPYKIVIEPQEYNQYAEVISPDKILVLPFSNLGQGSIPARNWVWEHSISIGAERHWILDDNIDGFYRLHDNLKVPVSDGTIFRCAEDFTDRYKNVGKSGFNYFMFAPRKSPSIRPFTLNTRVYSCILLNNSLTHRWRGKYNEDTDLSIRILKDGLCTILFNAFLALKSQTMTMKGGNTDELYKDDGRYLMAKSLQEQHPEIVRIAWKWGRWQHHVNYSGFKNNKLILKDDIKIDPNEDPYQISLKILDLSEKEK